MRQNSYLSANSTTIVRFVRFKQWVLLLGSFFVLCGESSAQDFKTFHDGVEHAQVEHKIGEDPVKINLLRLDLTKVRLDVHHALDKAIGLETTSSIAKRKGAVAAINAGFFRLDKSEFAGDASGLLMIDGQLVSDSSNDRVGVAILNGVKRTDVVFGHLKTKAIVGFGTDSVVSFDGINRERKSTEIILFTPDFNANTLTDSGGIEIAMTDCQTNESRRLCRRAEIFENKGNTPIPRDGLVVSLGKDALEKSNNILYFAKNAVSKPGDFENTFRVIRRADGLSVDNRGFYTTAEDITNGVPQLIKDGKIDITWEQEKASRAFVFNRHPRTAVAKMKDGKFLMVTVDGRQPGVSVGMNLNELAEYLLSLGAVDAMNLDGGGSTAMFLDGKVVNTPSDKEGERKIGDAILVTLRRK